MHFELLIRNGTCVTPWGEEAANVGVSGGRIATLSAGASDTADHVIDASGLHVLPGLIDSHVHLRDPGDPAVETLSTGTRAAVLGGIATLFDMPNTNPPIADQAQLDWKRGFAEQQSFCDIGLYIAGAKTNIGELAHLESESGVCAIKVFAGSSTASLLVEDDEHLEKVMRAGRRRIAFHSEDEYRLQARKPMFSRGMPHRSHMEWRDEECAFLGTRRLMALARKTGRPAHILHVSTAEELGYLRDYRDVATVEVLVNHLTQVAPDCYDTLKGFGVMNPPIRGERHREAAGPAARRHRRHHRQRSRAACARGQGAAVAGLPGRADRRADARPRDARSRQCRPAVTVAPRRSHGGRSRPRLRPRRQGRLAAGYDADFTLVDMTAKRTIEESWIVSPCGWTPFAGKKIAGWPVATIIRGHTVMRDDEVLGAPIGRLARFAS